MGSSLCYSSSLLILPRYHTKLWSLAHGIALAGNGIGGMGLSPANGALLQSVNVKTAFKVSLSHYVTTLLALDLVLVEETF